MSPAKVRHIKTGFVPRYGQKELYKWVKRFSAVCCHRRWGKSLFFINYAIQKGLECRFSNPQYALISPYLGQSKRNLWDPLKKYTKNFPEKSVNENEMRVDIWRSEDDRIRIQLFGADNPDALNGFYVDGVVLDEAQDHEETFYGKNIHPMLTDRLGWAHWYGTVRGKNYFWRLRQRFYEKMKAGDPDYFAIDLRASATDVIPAKELQMAREEMGDELFLQEYELSTETPNKGAFYGEVIKFLEKNNQITNVPFDPALPVHTAWDLGVDDHTSIWFFQILGREVRVIDYLEGTEKGVPEYAGMLKSKPYSYEEFLLPHDAAVKEFGSGRTRVESFHSHGFRQTKVVKRQTVADGIQAVRNILPRCYFDRTRCEKGLNALKEYQKVWDEKTQKYNDSPLHNWASHAADAFRTLALGMKREVADISERDMRAETEYEIFA